MIHLCMSALWPNPTPLSSCPVRQSSGCRPSRPKGVSKVRLSAGFRAPGPLALCLQPSGCKVEALEALGNPSPAVPSREANLNRLREMQSQLTSTLRHRRGTLAPSAPALVLHARFFVLVRSDHSHHQQQDRRHATPGPHKTVLDPPNLMAY